MKISSKAVEKFIGFVLGSLATLAGAILGFLLGKGVSPVYPSVFFTVIMVVALVVCVRMFPDEQTNARHDQTSDKETSLGSKTRAIPTGNESSWQEAYHECAEDLRHYNAMSWQIPSAVLVVDFIVLQLVYTTTNLSSIQRVTALIVAGIFGLILGLNFVKYVYRSGKRIDMLRRLEENLPSYSRRFADAEPWYVRSPLGYPAALFILMVSIVLLVLPLSFLC
jgi:hypothetical protein